MAHLLQSLQDYFTIDEINIDNWTFKLFYKASCALFMLGATIGVASQYFGDPISCEFQGLNSDLAQDYCWIHGSAYIPPAYQRHLKCIVEQKYRGPEQAPQTSFYQWVTFMMVLQAALFYLPYKVWFFLEGGLIGNFGRDGKAPVMISVESRYDDGVVMEAVVEKFVKYFKSILHHNTWYFVYFVTCELTNFLLLGVQIYFTDLFLDKKFAWYGYDTVAYYSAHTEEERIHTDSNLSNPMCNVFPTEVSCTIPNVGAAGEGQFHNGLCVLSQNIVNEKIYLAVWFWYAFLVPYAILAMFFRLFTIFFDKIRFNLIYKTIRHKYDKDIRKCLQYVLAKGQIGDWFVLYQLCKNCNPYFFREFIRELAIEIKNRPKKTKSTTTLATPQSPILSRPSPQHSGTAATSTNMINNGGVTELLGRRASLPRADDGVAV